VVEITDSSGRNRYDDIDLVAEARSTERYRIVDGDPLSCAAESDVDVAFRARRLEDIRTEVRTRVACTGRDFVVTARLEGYEGERRVRARFRGAHPAERKLDK
jgi:hypothetical protein